MKTLFCFLLLFQIISLSCKQRDDSSAPDYYAEKFIKDLNSTESFLYEIPSNKNLPDSYSVKSMRSYIRKLGFESLENGFDSIQIRIDYGCAMAGGYKNVAIVNKNSKWIAQLSKINHYPNDGGHDSITAEIEYKTPKSGWVKFIDSLISLKILSLQDENTIKGFEEESVADGCGVSVEIATKNVYRLYGYNNPEEYQKKFWQQRDILAILRLINYELGIKNFYPDFEDSTYDSADSNSKESSVTKWQLY